MIKNWTEMSKVDVSPYVEKRKDEKGKEFDYIPWVAMLKLLYENGAEKVRMGVIPDPQGNTVHMTEKGFADKNGNVNHCPEVHIWVEIDNDRYEYIYPVISGSFVVRDMQLNQQRIATAVIRAQCKCIAINTGLGISLWEKGDETETATVDIVELQSVDNLFRKFGTTVTRLIEKGMSEAEIADKLGFETDRVGDVIKATLAPVRQYEKVLNKLLKENGK